MSKLIKLSQFWDLLPYEATVGCEEYEYCLRDRAITFAYSAISRRISVSYSRLEYDILQHLNVDCGNSDWDVVATFAEIEEFCCFTEDMKWNDNTTIMIAFDQAMQIFQPGGELFNLFGDSKPVPLGYINDPTRIVAEFSFTPDCRAGMAIVNNASKGVIGESRTVWFCFQGISQTLSLESYSRHEWTKAHFKASEGGDVCFSVEWEMLWDLFNAEPGEISVTVTDEAINFESEKISVFGFISSFQSVPVTLPKIWRQMPKGTPIVVDYSEFINTLDKLCRESDQPVIGFQLEGEQLGISNKKIRTSLPSLWGKVPVEGDVVAKIIGKELLLAIECLPILNKCCIRVNESGILFSGFDYSFQLWSLGCQQKTESDLLESVPAIIKDNQTTYPALPVGVWEELKQRSRDLLSIASYLDSKDIKILEKQWWQFFGSQSFPVADEEKTEKYIEALFWFKEKLEIAVNQALPGETSTITTTLELEVGGKKPVVRRYQFRLKQNIRERLEQTFFALITE